MSVYDEADLRLAKEHLDQIVILLEQAPPASEFQVHAIKELARVVYHVGVAVIAKLDSLQPDREL